MSSVVLCFISDVVFQVCGLDLVVDEDQVWEVLCHLVDNGNYRLFKKLVYL